MEDSQEIGKILSVILSRIRHFCLTTVRVCSECQNVAAYARQLTKARHKAWNSPDSPPRIPRHRPCARDALSCHTARHRRPAYFMVLMCQFVIPICSMQFVNHVQFSLKSCHMSYVVIVSCLNRPFPVAPLRGSGSLCCSYPAAGYGEQRRLGKEL